MLEPGGALIYTTGKPFLSSVLSHSKDPGNVESKLLSTMAAQMFLARQTKFSRTEQVTSAAVNPGEKRDFLMW